MTISLLKAIKEGQEVPVVGFQLLTWNDHKTAETLERHIAKRTLEFYRVDATSVNLTPHLEQHEVVAVLISITSYFRHRSGQTFPATVGF